MLPDIMATHCKPVLYSPAQEEHLPLLSHLTPPFIRLSMTHTKTVFPLD
uniref:Uncharacterized protein n=1 Tax=Arundo donax TaxID=35708 RepID=A0A0A9C0C6_ARUDO